MRSRNPRRFPRARRRLQQKPKLATNEDPIHNRILELTVDLGNTVLTKRAAGDLYGYVHIHSWYGRTLMEPKPQEQVTGAFQFC